MAVMIVSRPITPEELASVSQDYGDYIKVVIDIEKEIIAAGGTLHTDGEKMLLENGSRQENLWGGGVDLTTKQTDCFAFINLRPSQNNPSQEILDQHLRERFFQILVEYFPE